MSTKHTPGPWRIREIRRPNRAPQLRIYGKGCAGPLAGVHKPSDGSRYAFEGDPAANANLIAAAPELLEAAKELLDNTAPDPDDPVWSRTLTSGFVRWDDLVAKLRDAIAKAGGAS